MVYGIFIYIGPQSQQLSINDLSQVYGEVEEARSQWYHIGLELRVSANDLDAIKSRNRDDPKDCLTEMLKVFLKRTDPKPTWAQLADAVGSKTVGYGYLVERIRKPKH